MRQELWLANVRILLWLNHLLAAHPSLYSRALFLTDKGADLALLLTVAWLWFRSPRPTIVESRARLILFGCAGIAAYIVTRLIAIRFDYPRPFVTYLPVRGTPGAFDGLRTFGTFPSDHAALLGALPVAFAYWSTTFGLVWMVLAIVWMLIRVAVGFHYPGDMLVGGMIGVVFALIAMEVYDRSHFFHSVANTVAEGFSRPAIAVVLYGALALVGIEFAMHFSHVLWALLTVRSWVA